LIKKLERTVTLARYIRDTCDTHCSGTQSEPFDSVFSVLMTYERQSCARASVNMHVWKQQPAAMSCQRQRSRAQTHVCSCIHVVWRSCGSASCDSANRRVCAARRGATKPTEPPCLSIGSPINLPITGTSNHMRRYIV